MDGTVASVSDEVQVMCMCTYVCAHMVYFLLLSLFLISGYSLPFRPFFPTVVSHFSHVNTVFMPKGEDVVCNFSINKRMVDSLMLNMPHKCHEIFISRIGTEK